MQIGLLGELTASYDGARLDLGGRLQRAVLAVLLLARGEVVPSERLADAVWGEHAPSDPAGALQAYVSHLRRRLQPDAPARSRSRVILREGSGYSVRLPADAVDAWRFEALVNEAETAQPEEAAALLRAGLELWRGPALSAYADEPWAEAEAARLTELRRAARERLMAAQLALGRAALVVGELEAMVDEEPLREERWRLLALGLYRAHRQADALAALRRARRTLADELGVDPGPALRELEGQVLAQSPALSLAPAGHGRDPLTTLSRGRLEDRSGGDALVDRDGELAVLRSTLDRLSSGDLALLVVRGPSGIGKTRLVAEAGRLAAERSVRVLSARGSQLETAFAFGVVRQLLEPELRDPERREVLLDGAAAGARGVFDLADGDRVEGFTVLHGLYWLTVNLSADGPLVLAVDDAQWCDGASLRFLAYLVHRLAALPVLVLLVLRTGEANQHEDLLEELVQLPDAMVVSPRPLSPAATAELVERRLGQTPAPLFATACHQTTSGNPFLLCQLLQALARDEVRPDAAHADKVVAVGSRAISSRVMLRLRRLPDDVVEVATAAAVLGDGAALPTVAALAGVSEGRAAEALALLVRAEIVEDRQPVAFVHPLVRDAVYRALPAAERELLHERAASALEGARADDEQVAAHVLLAPPRGDDRVVGLLRTAARAAADRGASESAVTYLRRALAESPVGSWRRDVVLELGTREAPLDGPAAVEHLVQAYRLHDEPRLRAEIAIATASTQVFASPPGVATAFAREASAGLPEELLDQRQALVAVQRIAGFMHGLVDGWRTPAPEPTGQGPGARMLAATVALEALLEGLDRERALTMARFALDGDHLIAVDDGLFWVNAAAVLTLADDDLRDFWSRARDASQARGSLFAALSTSLWEGFWQWRRGELHEALGCLRAALDQDRLWGGTRVGEPFARGFQIGCHLDRGDLAAARQAADAFTGPAFGDGGRVHRQAVARLLVAEGRFDDALSVLGPPGPAPGGFEILNPAWNPWRGIRAAALHGLGRTAEALASAEEEVALLRRWGAPSVLGAALTLRGHIRGAAGVHDLREAVGLLGSTAAAVDHARAECALGARPDVEDAEAVPLLLDACRRAEARGALGLAAHAREELARRGHRVEPRREDDRPLSRTDRRILDLTAAGLDPHEIAQRLFVTPGTVRSVLDESGLSLGAGARGNGSGISQVLAARIPHHQEGSLS